MNRPRETTVGWLKVFLQYAHTVSGNSHFGQDFSKNAIIAKLAEKTGLPLTLSKVENRKESNSRWLNVYCQAVMDTDALANVVYGDLYIPLTLEYKKGQDYKIEKKWIFAAGTRDAVYKFTSDFCKCFWMVPPSKCTCAADLHHRTLTPPGVTPAIHETWEKSNGDGYDYKLEGIPGVSHYEGSMMTTENPNKEVVFTWISRYKCDSAETILHMNTILVGVVAGMDNAFKQLFEVKNG